MLRHQIHALFDLQRRGFRSLIALRTTGLRLDLGYEPQKNDKREWGVLTYRIVEL